MAFIFMYIEICIPSIVLTTNTYKPALFILIAISIPSTNLPVSLFGNFPKLGRR